MTSKKTPAERFQALAAALPEPPTSLLATAHSPAVSPAAYQAARQMVGDLGGDPGRVDRIAAQLDRLVRMKRADGQAEKKHRGQR
jgi:hypothetical protein